MTFNNVVFFFKKLENVVPEYDTILLLSTTKWIHLNFGDEGIKRVFKRIHAQLRPGKKIGKFKHLLLNNFFRRKIHS